jgi:hypothetical protein
MKVYIVTDGEYSDYCIEKVFSNKPAVEEYRKWHNITNAIEEYEVYDKPFEQSDGDKVMLIRVEGKVYPEAVVGINYTIRPDVITDLAKKRGVGFGSVGFNDYYTLYLYRYIPADLWDEEKCKAKYTKALHDLAGIAKAMLADGASVYDVECALREEEIEDE